MGFWLDMVFGKSPLQSELNNFYGEFNSARAELETIHKKVEADRKVLAALTEHVTLQTTMNTDVHEALGKIADNATDNAGFAGLAAEEITAIKARLDLLEANVTVHRRVKPKTKTLRASEGIY